eukprot:TRINITY_DN17348_c0_g1_i1.p1 TRINITY_DN17348_c0_g1~~TRINITY_DN17348_c0_g1_i1.p1  ORF type:complete len:140 (-),score=16.34 TRINITY_DN17348_c0_g1_i1:130-549(-)
MMQIHARRTAPCRVGTDPFSAEAIFCSTPWTAQQPQQGQLSLWPWHADLHSHWALNPIFLLVLGSSKDGSIAVGVAVITNVVVVVMVIIGDVSMAVTWLPLLQDVTVGAIAVDLLELSLSVNCHASQQYDGDDEWRCCS